MAIIFVVNLNSFTKGRIFDGQFNSIFEFLQDARPHRLMTILSFEHLLEFMAREVL
jgi:hypothetical protein